MRRRANGASAQFFTGRVPWTRTASLPLDLGGPAPRRDALYKCARGHDFTVAFARDATPPAEWSCRTHGVGGHLEDSVPSGENATCDQPSKPKPGVPGKTHLEYVFERRSVPELEDLLDERLAALRNDRMTTTPAGGADHHDDTRAD